MKVKYIKQGEIDKLEIDSGFVIAGDIHLYNHYPYSSPISQNSSYSLRLNDISRALYKCGATARHLKVPLILNGDLLQTGSYDHATLHSLTMFLKTFSDVQMYINTGNHDTESGYSMIAPLVNFRDNTNHLVITTSIISPLINSSKHHLVFMPYMSKKDTLDKLKKISEFFQPKNDYILIIHNTFASSRFANNTISMSGISPKLSIFRKFSMVIASDVHKYQEIMNGHGFYTSSLIPLNFGERTKEHGFHIIDLGKNTRYFVIPNAPRFKQLALSAIRSMPQTQLKTKVRGNIIKVVDDNFNRSKPTDKEKVRDLLTSKGAIYVAFSSAKYLTPQDAIRTPVVKTTESKETIVTRYAKKLAKEHNLNLAKAEESGIKILKAAEIKSSREREEK